jgi:hypothetical protein
MLTFRKETLVDAQSLFVFFGMDASSNQNGSQPTTLRWLIGMVAAALCVIALALTVGAVEGSRAIAQPTPCPDTIACHALKRMPTQSVPPANTP